MRRRWAVSEQYLQKSIDCTALCQLLFCRGQLWICYTKSWNAGTTIYSLILFHLNWNAWKVASGIWLHCIDPSWKCWRSLQGGRMECMDQWPVFQSTLFRPQTCCRVPVLKGNYRLSWSASWHIKGTVSIRLWIPSMSDRSLFLLYEFFIYCYTGE